MIYRFKIGQLVWKIEADNALSAMEMMNRKVMDGLNMGSFAWYDLPEQNSFYCGLGNNFD